MIRRTAPFSCSLVAALAVACSGTPSTPNDGDDVPSLVADGEAAHDVESQASALTSALQLGVTAAASTPDQAAQAASAASRGVDYFRPAGCLTSKLDAVAHQVTHVLSGCSGPWGLLNVSGTVTIRYSDAEPVAGGGRALKLDVTGTALRVRRATADFAATATLVATGATREMTWTGQTSGETDNGRTFSRRSSWKIGWVIGEACLSLSGSAEGKVRGRDIHTEVTGYRRCRGECPEAGGRITITARPQGTTVSIDFDGTSVATLTDARGATSAIRLVCGG